MKQAVKKSGFNVILIIAVTLAAAAIFIGGTQAQAAQIAVSANAAADYSSGAHSVIDVNPVGGPRSNTNNILPTISDISVCAYGKYFYRLERYSGDNITKFSIDAPSSPVWQFSTLDNGETASSNPHAMVFANDNKAYLLRYGKTKAWIVNPSTADEAGFKMAELDLSAYGDDDGIPEMTNGVVVGNKLFILLQRLNRNDNWTPGTAYIAVFDIGSDTEIDTGMSGDAALKGIRIEMTNPNAIQYVSENGLIYIGCQGRFESSWSGVSAQYSGGILSLNPKTYEVKTVLDDGDDASHPYGNFSNMVVTSAEKGYFIGYAASGDNTLYAFNPSNSAVLGHVADALKNKNLSTIAVDQNRYVWVGNSTDSSIAIINSADDTIDEQVATNLNPVAIAFAYDELFTAYMPYFMDNSDVWGTALALKNSSRTENSIYMISGYDTEGNGILGGSGLVAARGQANPVFMTEAEQKGWIRVDASQPLIGQGGWSAADGSYMADMRLVKELSEHLVISHFAQDAASWDTSVMICNPNSSETQASVTFVSTSGSVIAEQAYTIPANGSIEVKAADLMPENAPSSGSIEISASQGVAAIAHYNNLKSGGNAYSVTQAEKAE